MAVIDRVLDDDRGRGGPDARRRPWPDSRPGIATWGKPWNTTSGSSPPGSAAEIRPGHARRRLIGAYFTQEYALEAAALFNPSIVPHPDQTGCGPGETRFVMSLRAVGEGHLSCIVFRSGTIDSESGIRLDPPGRFLDTGRLRAVAYDRDLFRARLAELGHDGEDARFLWSMLPHHFDAAELDVAVGELTHQRETRGDSRSLVDAVRWMAASNYAVEFDEHVALSERVLWPAGPAESHGMEDARFVRFTDGEHTVYYATYTAFDGTQVAPHLLETSDFRTFTISQLSGPSARNKGMALFPRRIAGRYVALSRWDRESNAIAYSDDGRRWGPGLHGPGAHPRMGADPARQLRLADRDPAWDGWSSRTASGPCGSTPSVPSCSTWTSPSA